MAIPDGGSAGRRAAMLMAKKRKKGRSPDAPPVGDAGKRLADLARSSSSARMKNPVTNPLMAFTDTDNFRSIVDDYVVDTRSPEGAITDVLMTILGTKGLSLAGKGIKKGYSAIRSKAAKKMRSN
ncbi:MAG: hypothetical protein Unbinned1068contig1001_19 [Prokaryotic dsDNA virus sp.]|nr:MAG: hypothetical protein Unbinned1068contig1001_19 [Prokaryotic dsDNA virus sp.]|tara:strand:- start:125 stop:499 length:375 start_codon:yes stop_codon:yes gene_type:complete